MQGIEFWSSSQKSVSVSSTKAQFFTSTPPIRLRCVVFTSRLFQCFISLIYGLCPHINLVLTLLHGAEYSRSWQSLSLSKIARFLYGTRKFITVLTKARYMTLPWA